jgi:hypothetical protein
MTSTPRTEAGMGERARAVTVAAWMLDRPNADPDDDLALLSRQFLRCIDRATSDGEWTTERQPGDDEECERLGCEDRTHPVHHRAATPPALDRETLRAEVLRDTARRLGIDPGYDTYDRWAIDVLLVLGEIDRAALDATPLTENPGTPASCPGGDCVHG